MLFKTFTNNTITNKLIIVILIIDLLFIIADFILHCIIYINPNVSALSHKELRISLDLSYAEFFQYFKYLAICGIILFFILFKKNYYYIPWLLLFLALFLDDAFQFHENSAVSFIDFFNLKSAFGLTQQDIGELAYSAFMGSILLIPLAIVYFTGPEKFKKTSMDIALLFGVFLFFGIGVDMIHSLIDDSPLLGYIVGLIEDGGEMIVLSLLTWYFAYIIFRPNESNNYLYKYLYKKKIPILGI